MSPIAQNRPFTAHRSSFNAHRSSLIVQKSVSYVLMSNPFGAICVNKKPRTPHADVSTPPHNSSLIANDSLPKNLLLLFFCRKIHKTVHKNAKNSLKNRLVHPSTIAPPIKYLIICYLILYNFVHCFSLSFLEPILILQRKSFQNNI